MLSKSLKIIICYNYNMDKITNSAGVVEMPEVVTSRRSFTPSLAKVIPEQAELKFHGVIFDVYQWPQEMFDGSTETFEMLRRADTVKIIAILTPEELQRTGIEAQDASDGNTVVKNTTDDGNSVVEITTNKDNNVVNFTTSEEKIVITKQRQPRKDWFYDYPGGRNDDPREDELAAAQREMREETGMEFRDWKLINVHQPFAKIDWLVYNFVATGLIKRGEQKLDVGEEIEVLAMDFDELIQLTDNGDSRYLRFNDYDKYDSLAELKEAPELYKYE